MSAFSATAISHVVVEVSDPARARDFYSRILGAPAALAAPWAEEGAAACALPSGQHLVLLPSAAPRSFADTAVHVACHAAPAALAAIVERADAAGIPVHRYIEDRPEEVTQNHYLADPDGNRIQLVSGAGPGGGIGGIDHVAVQVSDIEWEDDFWVEALGFPAVHRVGWCTADFIRARDWGEGKEDMAPGCRRWDQRYRDIPGAAPGQGRKVARPNPQIFLDLGDGDKGPVLALYLAPAHVQEPSLEHARGTPRTAFRVADAALDSVATALRTAGGRVDGPIVHAGGSTLARSVYLRDRCGVFFEFCSWK